MGGVAGLLGFGLQHCCFQSLEVATTDPFGQSTQSVFIVHSLSVSAHPIFTIVFLLVTVGEDTLVAVFHCIGCKGLFVLTNSSLETIVGSLYCPQVNPPKIYPTNKKQIRIFFIHIYKV